ncbi:MAG: efflux RND transporter permease subunit [Rubrivivax sp.]|nr:efflux RND transporter permease subunit [Rubrivivax sp.]
MFREMGIALVMGVALMYLILVMQFGSFTAPLAVMLSPGERPDRLGQVPGRQAPSRS